MVRTVSNLILWSTSTVLMRDLSSCKVGDVICTKAAKSGGVAATAIPFATAILFLD